jgi:predicted RND superfamily exporter protein
VQASTWYRPLHGLFQWTLRHRRTIPLVFLAFGVASVGLTPRLKVDNFLLEDWPEDDPQKQDYYWFEDHFGGVRPFEMEVRLSDSTASVWDLDVLRDIEKVEDWLHREHGIRAILSPAGVVRSANQAMNGGDPASHVLPDDPDELRRLVKRATSLGGSALMGGIASEDGSVARISGRMRDEGGYIHRQRARELDAMLATLASPAVFKQTGMAHLIDLNNEKLSGQLIGGLVLAFVLIGLIMAWVFRNWRMTLIAMVPNIFPLLFVGGIMALSGIDIKVSTAIIFTIAFGIAVDDTIHLLGKLRIELRKGRSLPVAMKRSVISTGKAVIITSIMLCSGFIALVMSDFASVFYMGLLVSLTLALAVVADLLLLPVLVVRFLPRRRSEVVHE